MSYDPYTFKLVTLTEDYITVWSVLSGVEIRRYKNTKDDAKDVSFYSHSSIFFFYIFRFLAKQFYMSY